MGHYSNLTRDASMEELTAYYGGFYGYQMHTGYPVFDDPQRVSRERTPWAFDTVPTLDDVQTGASR